MQNELKEEYELYLKMKDFYPSLLQESPFETELKDAITYLSGQLNDGYIDLHDGCCDELSFRIIQIALREYIEKRNIVI
jgi:hypothetical protein